MNAILSPRELGTRAGQLRRVRRPVSVLLASTFAILSGMLFVTQTQAYAFQNKAVKVIAPRMIATALATGAGGGTVTGIAATGTTGAAAAAGAAPATVAVAGVVAFGAGYYAGTEIQNAWRWANGRLSTAYDPPSGTTYTSHPGWLNGSTNPMSYNYNGTTFTYGVASQPGYGATTGEVEVILTRDGSGQWHSVDAQCAGNGYGANVTAPGAGGTVLVPASSCASQGGIGHVWVNVNSGGKTGLDRYTLPGTAQAPSAPSGPSGSTVVTTRPTSKCSNGATVVGEAVTFTGATPDADLPPIIAPACPEGTTRTEFSTPTTFPDGSAAPSPIGTWTAQAVPGGYPECQGNKQLSCVLTLLQVSQDGQVLQNCTGNTGCAGWSRDLSPETVTTRTDPATDVQTLADGTTRRVVRATSPTGQTYRCNWGPYILPVAECTVLMTEPATVGTPTAENNCELSDFSLNPVSWVVVPLKCLFIPRESAVRDAGVALSTAWNGTAPAVVFDAIGDVLSPVIDLQDTVAQGCEGPVFTFPALAGVTDPFSIHPLSTCNELTQYMLGVWMPLHTAFLYLGGFFAGTRILLKPFGLESPVEEK